MTNIIFDILSKTLILVIICKVLGYIFNAPWVDYLFFGGLGFIIIYEFRKAGGNVNNVSNEIINKIPKQIFNLTDIQKTKLKEIGKKMNFSNSYEKKEFDFFNLDIKNENKKEFDEVKFLDNGLVEVYNKSGFIDLEKYQNNSEKIKHYLGTETIKITKHNHNSIILDIFDRFPKGLNLDISYLKKGKIFLGIKEDGEPLYINLDELSHIGMSGAAGAGKSVHQRLILSSLLFNLDLQYTDEKTGEKFDYVDRIYLIDYKMVSYFQWQFIHPKIKVATNNEEVFPLIEECFNINKERQLYLISTPDENGDYKEKIITNMIFIMFDEFAEFKDSSPDPKTNKEEYLKFDNCMTQIKSITQTGRSNNLRIFIASQTLKTEVIDGRIRSNLQSRILMKSKDEESIVACLGSREPVEELGVNPKLFNYGRHIFLLDTPKGVINYYLQGLYSPENFYKEIMKLKGWKLLNQNDLNNNQTKLINIFSMNKNNSIEEKNNNSINLKKISYNDLENKRKELWNKTSFIQKEEMQKSLRSQLIKMKNIISNKTQTEEEILTELDGIEGII